MPVPRADLHVHLEGTVQADLLLRIARRNDAPLPADTVEGLAALYEFAGFDDFLHVWNVTTNCLRRAADFAEITEAFAGRAAADGARYVEAIFSPAERVLHGVSLQELFEGYCEGVTRAWDRHGVVVRLTPDLFWSVDVALAEETARWAVRYRDRGVVGLGVGGGEQLGDPEPLRRAFQIARDGGVVAVPHAGETTGPERVRRVLAALAPHRLRHGIGAARDPRLLAELAERGIGMDLCPTSNVRTRVVSSPAEVPLAVLHAAGIKVTVGTDDPAMLGTDLATEYEIAARAGIDAETLWANTLATCAAEPELVATMRTW